MNEEKGYIKLFRSITDNFLWEDRATKLQAWLDLLMMVNYRDKKTYFNNRLIEVKRGEIITSERKLAERWKWDKRTVKKFLETLQTEKMITFIIEENVCTTINVVNYCKYQGFLENDVPLDVPLTTPPDAPLDVPPNVPNIKKDNKGKESKERKRNNKPPLSPLGEMVEKTDYTKTLKDKLHDWLKYKSEKKQSYKPTGFKTLLKKIDDVVKSSGEQTVIDAIDASMSNNWQGLFFDKFIIDTTSVPKQQTFNMDEFLKRYDE